MAVPQATLKVARAIYEYAGVDDLPDWRDLPPTIQISYIEEAEAALRATCDHIKYLANNIDPDGSEELLVKGTLVSVSDLLDPRVKD
jgi:hypothetical protein